MSRAARLYGKLHKKALFYKVVVLSVFLPATVRILENVQRVFFFFEIFILAIL